MACLVPGSKPGKPVLDPLLGVAYGHLAATLRPLMVEATDEQLEVLTAKRFLPVYEFAFDLGANPCGSLPCPACTSTRGEWQNVHVASGRRRAAPQVRPTDLAGKQSSECHTSLRSVARMLATCLCYPGLGVSCESTQLYQDDTFHLSVALCDAESTVFAAQQGLPVALLAAQRLPVFRAWIGQQYLKVMIKAVGLRSSVDDIAGPMIRV